MGMPVVTVASGGLPVTAAASGGMPVDEAPNGYGLPVTYVASGGMPVAVSTNYDASSTALFAAMSVQPSASRKTTIDTLIKGLKTDNLWSRLPRLQIYAAHDEQAAKLEWKSATAVVAPQAAPAYVIDRGWTLVPANLQYLSTGMIHSVFGALNSCGFGLWIASGTSITDACGGSSGVRISMNKGGSGAIAGSLAATSTVLCPAGSAPVRNVDHYVRRTNASTVDYFADAVVKAAAVAQVSSLLQTTDLWLGRNNTAYTDDRYFACYFDDGTLSNADIANLHARLLAYKTALGA